MSWVAWVIVAYFMLNFGVTLALASVRAPRKPFGASDVMAYGVLAAVTIWAVTHPEVLS